MYSLENINDELLKTEIAMKLIKICKYICIQTEAIILLVIFNFQLISIFPLMYMGIFYF